MSSQEATSGMKNDDKFIKLTKQKEKRSLVNNQTVMRVSRIVTTKHEEVEYYPLPDGVFLTHSHLYNYEIKPNYRCGNDLVYSEKTNHHNKTPVKLIKPFPKNEADEENIRFISQTRSKYNFKVIGMSFLETAKRLYYDMWNSDSNYYDRECLDFFNYTKEINDEKIFTDSHYREDFDKISEDDYYKLIQSVL
jgi:hypothetical protein